MEIEHRIMEGFTLDDLDPGDGFRCPGMDKTIYIKACVSDSIMDPDKTDVECAIKLPACVVIPFSSDVPIIPILIEKIIVKERKNADS